jgi:hypothetical protein
MARFVFRFVSVRFRFVFGPRSFIFNNFSGSFLRKAIFSVPFFSLKPLSQALLWRLFLGRHGGKNASPNVGASDWPAAKPPPPAAVSQHREATILAHVCQANSRQGSGREQAGLGCIPTHVDTARALPRLVSFPPPCGLPGPRLPDRRAFATPRRCPPDEIRFEDFFRQR